MNQNKKQTLVSRLTRHGVPASIANALAQSGLLTYEQSRAVRGIAVREQAMSVYESASNRATITRVWNPDRLAFDYEAATAERTLRFSSIREMRASFWLCDDAVFKLVAYGRELRTLARNEK